MAFHRVYDCLSYVVKDYVLFQMIIHKFCKWLKEKWGEKHYTLYYIDIHFYISISIDTIYKYLIYYVSINGFYINSYYISDIGIELFYSKPCTNSPKYFRLIL